MVLFSLVGAGMFGTSLIFHRNQVLKDLVVCVSLSGVSSNRCVELKKGYKISLWISSQAAGAINE